MKSTSHSRTFLEMPTILQFVDLRRIFHTESFCLHEKRRLHCAWKNAALQRYWHFLYRHRHDIFEESPQLAPHSRGNIFQQYEDCCLTNRPQAIKYDDCIRRLRHGCKSRKASICRTHQCAKCTWVLCSDISFSSTYVMRDVRRPLDPRF